MPFALLLSVALAAMLIVIAHPASAGALTIRSAKATTPGWSTTQIEVSAASDSPITKITARLRLFDRDEPFATAEDFALVSGTATDGVWRTSQQVPLELGLIDIGVDATDASGATVTKAVAIRLDRRGNTRFSEFTISPSTVDIDHDTVTYAGRLVYKDGDGNDVGVPGATICLNLNGACVGYGKAGSDGRFSTPVRLYIRADDTNMINGDAYASYEGSSQYFWADSTRSPLKVRTQLTRLSIGFSSLPTVIGTTVQVTGRLERKKADGQWTGAAGQDVRIYAWDPDTQKETDFGKTRTRSDGSYSKSVVVPQAGQWFADFSPYLKRNGAVVLGPYAPSNELFDDVVYSYYRTSFSRFTMSPSPAGKGAQITANAVLTKRTATGAALPVTTSYVDLEFSKDKKHWTWAGQGRPGANGQVKIRATAVSSGYWRLHYFGWARELASVGGTAYATVKYRTAVSGFNAKPEPVRKGKTITVSGTLKYRTSTWHALGRKNVNIYFQAHGSKSWSYVGTAATDRYGRWHKGFKARKDGTWMAKYAGNVTYLAASSVKDYVDVR
ncbi:hypothetical protein GCM10023194_70900 [Planotetraspora phitsanulokensis]|uniref:Uncharacterized protein n=1 Tax=Planotetraspora phitsanulokensis TaxID=575192 RepID=A0A8J3UGE4_9ACTN|nr:hypothetical protein [Planotetraspora phitsanulokensis]GII43227.1 hypothetical protein Pph01_82300 [Planotetraspora phitsanulokensis]